MRIRKLIAPLCLVVFITHLNACTEECDKRVPCPGYEENELDAWLPIDTKTKLTFSTNTNLQQTFTFYNVYTSKPAEVRERTGACMAHKRGSSVERDNIYGSLLELDLQSTTPFYETKASLSATIRLMGTTLYAQDLQEKGFLEYSTYNNNRTVLRYYYNSIQLNGKSFSNVQSAMIDTLGLDGQNTTMLYRIYIAKGQGLIAYETYPGLLWVKE
jgi:hypothetical protein